ncbi:MAG TPA: twin-arginine translocation signal domain-containing protein, partial [Candidatus Sutterella merdavium]|nr:twin-arginine translocation signal domain-containing protein [Candidatus Sutterella merdavium]
MSTVNRRSFLKVAAGVAAGSVAGLSHAMGSEGVKWDETH